MNYEEQLAHLFTLDGVASLLTLTVMEVVLGIDNIIFISIITNKLPRSKQPRGRFVGLTLALLMRVVLLFSISWLASMKDPIPFFQDSFGIDFTGRGLILLAGGIFLLVKTTTEIHNKIEGKDDGELKTNKTSFASIVAQIVVIDIVFSFDSILTAIGMSQNFIIMVAAVIIAMIIMLLFSGKVSDFINRHPTVKMLALAFLLMIAFLLILEGVGQEVDKKYVYIAMAFSFGVEVLNMRMRKKSMKKESNPDSAETKSE